MPTEHRQITFSLDEILRAVTDLVNHHGVLPAQSVVTGIRITEVGDQVAGMLSVTTKGAGKARELPLTAALLGAALIRHCRKASIPLPRVAKKRLVRAGEGLAMHLNIPATEASVSPKAPVDHEAATALPSAEAPTAPAGATGADPHMPDWWSTMSRGRR